MQRHNKNTLSLILVGAFLIFSAVGILIIVAKRDNSKNLNHNFKRTVKYIAITTAKGFDLKGIDAQKIRAYKDLIYLYDIRKNQIVSTDFDGNIKMTYGSFGREPGQFQVVIDYQIRKDGLHIIDHQNKYYTHWAFNGKMLSYQKFDRLGRLIYVNTDTILCKVANIPTVDDDFAYYYPSIRKIDTLTGILPVYHDRGIVNDGFFATNGKLFFHIAYYTKHVYCFNSKSLLYKFSTIDNNDKPPVVLHVNNTYSPASDAVIVNGDAAADAQNLYVLSQIRSNHEDRTHFKSWTDIDVYSTVNGAYQYTYAVENYQGNYLKFFEVYDNKLILLNGNHISIINL